jgi:hypothetical protein
VDVVVNVTDARHLAVFMTFQPPHDNIEMCLRRSSKIIKDNWNCELLM